MSEATSKFLLGVTTATNLWAWVFLLLSLFHTELTNKAVLLVCIIMFGCNLVLMIWRGYKGRF